MAKQRGASHKYWKRVTGGTLMLAVVFISLLASNSIPSAFPKWEEIYAFCGVKEPLSSELPMKMTVFDVGAADAIVLECDGYVALVDAGMEDAGERIAAWLVRKGYDEIDLFVATHQHADHIGGMPAVLRRLGCSRAVTPLVSSEEKSREYRLLEEALAERNTPLEEAAAGERFLLGRMEVEILRAGGSGKGQNNDSIVCRVTFGETVFLLMGDAEEETEIELLASGERLQADVLKIGHHGSKTSTAKAFLQAVGPRFAAISCGEANPPDEEVLDRLRQNGVEYKRTDLDGLLLFASDGERVEVQCAVGAR